MIINNLSYNIMLYYRKNNKVYKNRKQLRDEIGINPYKRECKNGNIIFLNQDK